MPILNWLTRETDLQTSIEVPYRLLEPVAELGAGEPNENMLIQGDNLEALKSLLPFYAGKIKCIYIDPPYNTKSAFEHYDDNLEHTEWLAMIYPRLELLRDLLAEDGSIWVSIDDNEGHYLKVIMDEVFGRKNFVSNVVWQKKYSPQNDAKWLSDNHDHILVFAKNKEKWRPNVLPRSEEMDARYKNPDKDVKGLWKATDFSRKAILAHTIYDIILPSGRVVSPPKNRSWLKNETDFHTLVKENRIWFGPKGDSVPSYKRYLNEVKDGVTSMTIWTYDEVGHNQDAKREVMIFNEDDVFDTPKPEKLIHKILTLATKPNEIVLDSFLGSGTTASVAHKMGRQYIGIEMGEHCFSHCVPRLKKVIDGEQGGVSKVLNWKGGGGFRFYNLGEPVFDDSGKINPNIRYAHLASHIWFCETHSALDKPAISPLLGVFNGVAYYLLFNGILGDKRPDSGNVLTNPVLRLLPTFDGPKVIYGESSRLGAEKLKALNITFKQTPYDIKAR